MINDLVTNTISVAGDVVEDPVLSHTVYGENFYSFPIKVDRLSGASDVLSCILPALLLCCVSKGGAIEVSGQIRSYNRIVNGLNRLDIKIFVREVFSNSFENCLNEAMLKGYICKPPVYRVTPFGREITDMLLAVNRAFNKSDYIPVIAWGRNARLCGKLEIGQKLCVTGRMQSRDYEKTCDGETFTRTAYELSACTAELLEENDQYAN